MRTKHTNGQWTAEKENKNYSIFSDKMYIGSISSSDVESEQAEANTKLIASAPELLEALQSVADFYKAKISQTQGADQFNWECRLKEIQPIIDKATK